MSEPRRGLAPYMQWAKQIPAVACDLAGSNLLGCEVVDLPGCREEVELNGSNPDGYPPLIEAIASRYGVSTDRVATAPGAGGANFLALAALVRTGDEVLVERPAYDPLLGALRFLGAAVRRFDRAHADGFALDPDRVSAGATARTRLIVLTSPHNPSGALAAPGALLAVGRLAERLGARVLVDEVYLDSVYADRPPPAATLGPVFLSTNSLTKSYGLSGLRAGWVIGDAEVAEAARRVRDVMDGVGSFPSDRLACFAFRHLDRLEARARAILEPNLARLDAFIRDRPRLSWARPAGGTVAFPRIAGLADTTPFAERLLREYSTAVVPGAFFEAPAHIRIAFGCGPETLRDGLDRLGLALEPAP